jgi:hypothetical protein
MACRLINFASAWSLISGRATGAATDMVVIATMGPGVCTTIEAPSVRTASHEPTTATGSTHKKRAFIITDIGALYPTLVMPPKIRVIEAATM